MAQRMAFGILRDRFTQMGADAEVGDGRLVLDQLQLLDSALTSCNDVIASSRLVT